MNLPDKYFIQSVNDQKIGNCYICKVTTKLMSNYCMIGTDNDEDDPCDFVFKLCKVHKNKKEKVFIEHIEEHTSIDIV